MGGRQTGKRRREGEREEAERKGEGERGRENIIILREQMLRSEILDLVIPVLTVSWGRWQLVGMYKAKITKKQN